MDSLRMYVRTYETRRPDLGDGGGEMKPSVTVVCYAGKGWPAFRASLVAGLVADR